MNKILLTAAALMLSITSYAGFRHNADEDGTLRITEVFSAKSPLKSFAKVSENPDDYPVVSDAPEGTKVTYLEDANVYFQIFGEIASSQDVGVTKEVIFCEDGTVWFKDFLSSAISDSYIKGTREGDKIRIDFPQAFKYITNSQTDETTKTFLLRLKHGVESYEDFSVYPIDEQYIEFTINEDGTLVTWDDPDDFVGMCTFNGGWYGMGSWNYSLRKLDATLVNPPTGIAKEDWTIIWEGFQEVYLYGGNKDVKVAVDNDKNEVYIGGLYDSDNITWIKGTIEDNKVTFPSGQYLGHDDYYDEYYFFMGAVGEVGVDDRWGLPTLIAEPIDQLVFDYNAETKTLALSEKGQMISVNRGNGAIYGDYMLNPVLQKQMADKMAAAPMSPSISGFFDWGGGAGMLLFSVPSYNVNYMILDTDNIFYNIYVNGELYTLTRDNYSQLGYETLTDIPYSYSFYDLSSYMGNMIFYWLIDEEIKTMGVCSFYEDPQTAERYYSDIVTYDVALSGVDEVFSAKEEVQTEWYDMTGTKISVPSKGIYIKVTKYSDGTFKSTKSVVR